MSANFEQESRKSNSILAVSFILSLLGGAFAIYYGAIEKEALLTIGIPIGLMFIHFFIGYFDFSGVGKKRSLISTEQFADSLYYLGFIFTLGAMAITLFVTWNVEEVVTSESITPIVNNFGLALITTIVGLIFRLGILSFLTTSDESIQAAEKGLEHAVLEFKDQTERSKEYMEVVNLNMQELADSLKSVDLPPDFLTSKLEEPLARLGTKLDAFSSRVDQMFQIQQDYLEKFQQLNENISDFSGVISRSSSLTNQASGELQSAQNTATHEIEESTNRIQQVNTQIMEMSEAFSSLDNTLNTGTSSISDSIDQSRQSLEEFNSSIRASSSSVSQIEEPFQQLGSKLEDFSNRVDQMLQVVGEDNLDKLRLLSTHINDFSEAISTASSQTTRVSEEVQRAQSAATHEIEESANRIHQVNTQILGINDALTSLDSALSEGGPVISNALNQTRQSAEEFNSALRSSSTSMNETVSTQMGELETALSNFSTTVSSSTRSFNQSLSSHNDTLAQELESSLARIQSSLNQLEETYKSILEKLLSSADFIQQELNE